MENIYFLEISGLTHGISIEETENKLTVFLTNFMLNFWKAEVDKNDLPAKSKEANSLISLSDQDIILKQIKERGEEYSVIETTSESLKLNVKYLIQNFPYNFHWEFKRCSAEDFQTFFTNPLIKILISQKLQIQHLTTAVKAKDTEIEQYKLNGATLVREQLATQEFNEEQFNKKWAVSDVEGFGRMLLNDSACEILKVALNIKESTERPTHVKIPLNVVKSPSKPKHKVNRPRDHLISRQQKTEVKVTYQSSEELIDLNEIQSDVVNLVPCTIPISQTSTIDQSVSASTQPERKKTKMCYRPLDI